MSDELPPLDDEMRGLLRGVSREVSAPQAARARVASRLSASLGIPLGVAGGLDAMDVADAAPPDMAMAPPVDAAASGVDVAGALVDPDVVATAAPAVLALAKGAAVSAPVATGAATIGAGAATVGAGAAGAGAAGAAASGTAASIGVLAMLTKPVVIGAFVAGSMLGGGTVKVVDEAMAPPPRVVYMPASVEIAPDDDEDVVDADVKPAHEPEMAPADARTRPTVKKPRAVTKPTPAPVDDGARAGADERGRSLARERSVLEVARTALSRGDAQAALISLEKHRAQFANGKLSEERDALLVLALVGTGRTTDAEKAGARFERTYPRSLLLSTVQAALAK